LNGDVTFRVFDRRVEPARGDPPEKRDEHRGGLPGDIPRERIAPSLALLLDELAFNHKTSQVLLGGLNRVKTKVFLYLPHRGRETFQKALADKVIDELPGLAGWRLG
jgi:hypothetical protein